MIKQFIRIVCLLATYRYGSCDQKYKILVHNRICANNTTVSSYISERIAIKFFRQDRASLIDMYVLMYVVCVAFV